MFSTTKSVLLLSGIALGSFALAGCGAPEDDSTSGDSAVAQSSMTSECNRTPALPSPTLAVPAGNELAFHYNAIGVQIYVCKATATGFGWVFQAPEATLYNRGGHQMATHYAGPTWQANDGSTVVGAKRAAFSVDPTAIPWLLLQAVSQDGAGRMTGVTYVQRLDTAGGLAPAVGCDAGHLAEVARVDYTANYYFYRAED
jgi:hypothetical protein